jgi:hypothetical protein
VHKRGANRFAAVLFLGILLICNAGDICIAGKNHCRIAHCISVFKNGSIDWTSGTIWATGRAAPEGRAVVSAESVPGAARADANRNLLDILKHIKINADLTIGDYSSKNDIILAGIEKTARDAVILKQYYTSALAVEITIETSMYGGFLQLVLPENIRQIPKITLEDQKRGIKACTENEYTGLIIDARGLDLKPVLAPVIVSEQGHAVYSSAFISREFAVQNGICKYVCDMDLARSDLRAGKNPIVFKGLRKEGQPDAAIVISMSDYRLLETITERHRFLKECRVIIVLDG